MKFIFVILTLLLNATCVNAQDLQHFNSSVLKQSLQNNIALLLPATAKAIKPIQVLTDINDDGYIYAATVTYPAKITLEQARQSINKLYKKYEKVSFAKNPLMGLWVIKDKGFGIQLSEQEDCGDKVIRVIYVPQSNVNKTEPYAPPDVTKEKKRVRPGHRTKR